MSHESKFKSPDEFQAFEGLIHGFATQGGDAVHAHDIEEYVRRTFKKSGRAAIYLTFASPIQKGLVIPSDGARSRGGYVPTLSGVTAYEEHLTYQQEGIATHLRVGVDAIADSTYFRNRLTIALQTEALLIQIHKLSAIPQA